MKAPVFLALAASVTLGLVSQGSLSEGPAARGAEAARALKGTLVSTSTNTLTDDLRKAGFDIPNVDIASDDFKLETLEGKSVSLSSFRGKVVILSFWATWCGPCKIEMPSMEKLYNQMKAKGLEIVAVDVAEDKSKVSAFIKQYGYTFPVLLDTTGEVSASDMYAAGGIPANYIIDRNGKLLARVVGVGGPEWDGDLRVALFDELLKQ